MKKQDIPDSRMDVYKWIKIGQSSILIILGILFAITSILNKGADSKESVGLMLSISIGVIATVYGLMDILSGYLLYRNPYNQDCLIGAAVLSLATVLFIKRDIINEILSYFVSIFMIIAAILLVIHGVDTIVGKGVKKSVPKAVLAFILAGLFVGLGITYLVFYIKDNGTVELMMLLVVGIILIIAGIASLAVILIKIKNTNHMLKQQKIEEEQESQRKINENDCPTNTDVKIIDISDLKKKPKGSSKNGEQSLIVVEEDKDGSAIVPAEEDK